MENEIEYILDNLAISDAWLYMFNERGSILEPLNNWDKYLIKSKQYKPLLDILLNEVIKGKFKQGKIGNKKYLDGYHYLCLYGDYDKGVLSYLKNKYLINLKIKDIWYKKYSDEEIKQKGSEK
jgi:hypothetical protein